VSKYGRLLGTLLLLGFLAWWIDWGQLLQAFAAVDLRLCLLAAGVLVLSQVVSSWRWLLLARVQNFGGGLGRFVAYYFVGMLFNLVLPTSVGGDVVRAWYLSAQEGSPPPAGRRLAAFLTVFAERFSGILMLMGLVCVAALCCPLALESWIRVCVASLGAATVLGLAFLVILSRLNSAPAAGILGRVRNIKMVRQLAEVCRLYLNCRGPVLAALGLSIVVQLGAVVVGWLLSRALGLAIPFTYLGVVVPLVALLTLLPITLNGIGLREAGTIVLLAPVGISMPQAVSLSFLNFALIVVVSVVAGLGCYLFGRFPRFEKDVEARTARERQALEVLYDEEPFSGHPDQGRTGQPPAAA
jgi:glycosyltransferase 2 family protein